MSETGDEHRGPWRRDLRRACARLRRRRARARSVQALRARAAGLERELALLAERAEERAEWARREERTRIARELHDVVAHRVSLMVVQAGAAKALVARDPEGAERTAELVGELGRQALEELREMLGVLRSADTVDSADSVDSAGSVGSAEEPPAEAPEEPPLDGELAAEVERLAGASRAAGVPVQLAVTGVRRPCPAEVERTAYRLVQEALTNVHKHAAGAGTRVRLAYREEELAVLVENDRRAAPEAPAADAALPSCGMGLVGMRERVTALGGGLVAGPTGAGGFRVSAVLPAPPGASAAAGVSAGRTRRAG